MNPDNLTIAYMVKGATRDTDKLIDAVKAHGEGELEYLSDVIALSINVEREFSNQTKLGDYYGCFAYEVVEPIGEWITEQTVLNGAIPGMKAVAVEASRLIKQHID